MTIEQLPKHIANPKEVLVLIRKYNKKPNPYFAYRLAELLGYEPDAPIATEKTTENPDLPVEYYF
jgi:hypothetical protein